jgi:hypothetical protein
MPNGKYPLIGLLIICLTVVAIVYLERNRVCDVRYVQGTHIVQASFAYEVNR